MNAFFCSSCVKMIVLGRIHSLSHLLFNTFAHSHSLINQDLFFLFFALFLLYIYNIHIKKRIKNLLECLLHEMTTDEEDFLRKTVLKRDPENCGL